jgi:signal transduction histidine kinase
MSLSGNASMTGHAAAATPKCGGPRADHVAQFYESADFLCDAASAFLADGLLVGQPLLVIATEAHRSAISARFATNGFDFDGARRSGQLRVLDAREALSTFMVDRVPDAALFRSSIGGLLEDGVRWCSGASVRTYGEMVDVLWRDGNPSAALRVEELWNDLAAAHSFSLLCAYAMGNFYTEAHRQQLEDVCLRHGRVLPAETYTRNGDDDTRLREITMLQQRARALENEIAERTKLERALRRALTERRRTEETLRHAKEEAERANRVKSDFLAVMSHELRTPLNAIIGYRDLLEQGVSGPVNDGQRLYLGRIKNGAQQLLRLIDQVLSLSKIESGKEELDRQPVDLAVLAVDSCSLIEPIAVSKGVKLTVHLPDRAAACETDGGRLSQILLNLLSNAAKFTQAGEIAVTLRIDDESAWFEVRDTGIGIAPGDLERIFEAFVQVDPSPTRRNAGTGLGLPVSRQLARVLGGDLTVESEAGRGSTFTLRIPVRPARSEFVAAALA